MLAAAVTSWIDSLDLLAGRVLRAASVFGASFWRGGVLAVAPELTLDEVAQSLDALAQMGLVARGAPARFAGEDTWTFAEPRVAEALEASLAPGDRAEAHGRAARWLQAVGELDAAVIASQLLRGDAPAEAAPWCAEAARTALHDGDYDAALSWSEHAISLGVDVEAEAALRMLEVGVHDARGAIELAERCAAEAWRVAPRGSMEWFRAASSLAVLSMRLLRPERFRELGPAIEEALRNPESDVAAAGLALAVFPMLQAGQYVLADLVIDRLEAILASGEHPEPTFPARVYAARALRALFDDDPAGYLTESTRAARSYESLGEHRFALLFWNNVGFAQVSLGDGAGAVETLNAIVRRASSLDLQRVVAAARHNLGLALMLTGRHAEACAIERHVVASANALGDAHLAATAWIYLARALLARGDGAGALDAVDRGLPALSMQPGARVFGLAIRAMALLRVGRGDDALRDAGEAMQVLGTVGSVEEGDALARLAYAEALRARGQRGRYEEAARAARERLMERAARVPEGAMREGFLRNIPEHARTLAL